jgi:hypothetical protein
MKERKNNQHEEVVHYMPPAWCSSICRNAMNEICVESCAIKRDCSAFEPKPNLNLSDMPRFPKTEGMTKEEKFTSVTVYLAKVVDHLKGIEDVPQLLTLPRASHAVSIDIAIAGVAAGLQGSQNDRTEARPNPLVGSEIITSKEHE